MKKSCFITGAVYLAVGCLMLTVALLTESRLEGILFGLAGAGIVPGIQMIVRYFYWSRPQNRQRYQEKREQERIEQHDERKEKLRDRAGRYAYALGLVVISLSILIFSVLGALGIVEQYRLVVLFLGGYLISSSRREKPFTGNFRKILMILKGKAPRNTAAPFWCPGFCQENHSPIIPETESAAARPVRSKKRRRPDRLPW